jgi:hypothetical protein
VGHFEYPTGEFDGLLMEYMLDFNVIVDSHDLVMITFDTLHYDMA